MVIRSPDTKEAIVPRKYKTQAEKDAAMKRKKKRDAIAKEVGKKGILGELKKKKK